MGTAIYPCGCSIGRSMFGQRIVMSVSSCALHACDEEVQELLIALSERIRSLQEAEHREESLSN